MRDDNLSHLDWSTAPTNNRGEPDTSPKTWGSSNEEDSEDSSSENSQNSDDVDNPLHFDNLLFSTKHLIEFEYVEKGLKLEGEEYRPIRKAVWYQLVSANLRGCKARFRKIDTDCRLHLAFVMPSGSGKKNIITFLKKVLEEHQGLNVATPTSLHPEQLIGKTLQRKDDGDTYYEQVRGHLDADLVIMDEAMELFRSNRDSIKQTRSYLNSALDIRGENKIEKRAVDIQQGEGIEMWPNCNAVMFLQPFKVDEEFAHQGTLRRFRIQYADIDTTPNMKGYEKRLEKPSMNRQDAAKQLSEQLNKMTGCTENPIRAEEEIVDRFRELHSELMNQGYAQSEKGMNFTSIVDFQLQNLLLKFSAIQAMINGHERIQKSDLEKAFIDFTEVFACTLKYVDEKLKGDIDYGEDREGALKEHREALDWLEKQGATSKEESEISIDEYREILEDLFDVGERQARRKMKEQEEREWIKKKQTSAHESGVWLTPQTVVGQGGKGVHDVDTYRERVRENTSYFELVEKYNDQ